MDKLRNRDNQVIAMANGGTFTLYRLNQQEGQTQRPVKTVRMGTAYDAYHALVKLENIVEGSYLDYR